jgi:membrane associated rhomboid family serine protease
MNMFALASLGPVLESTSAGPASSALYLLSALGRLDAVLPRRRADHVRRRGLRRDLRLFGAFYVVARKLGGDTRSILTLLVVNLVITFAIPIIDWRAHLGGWLTGALVASALAYAPRGARRTAVQAAACGAVLLLLVVAVAGRARILTG